MAVTLITIFGFIGFAMILDKFAFNFLFLRLWQFSAGFIALFYIKIREARLLPKKSETADEGKTKFTSPINQHDLVISALSVLALCMLPNVIPKLILRPLVTLTTSLIIGCQSQELRVRKYFKFEFLLQVSDLKLQNPELHRGYLLCVVFGSLASHLYFLDSYSTQLSVLYW